MAGLFDRKTIELPCPGCGAKQREQLGHLRTSPTITCKSCGSTINVDAKQFASSMRDLDRSVEKLRDTFRKLGR